MAQTGAILEQPCGLKARLAELEAELLRLAGPLSGEGLAWFTPATEQVRDERRRLW
jgi:hypothetical protein